MQKLTIFDIKVNSKVVTRLTFPLLYLCEMISSENRRPLMKKSTFNEKRYSLKASTRISKSPWQKNIDMRSIFDTNRILEITYHKSTLSQPAKIHLKLTNKKDKADIKYETLPLRNLMKQLNLFKRGKSLLPSIFSQRIIRE